MKKIIKLTISGLIILSLSSCGLFHKYVIEEDDYGTITEEVTSEEVTTEEVTEEVTTEEITTEEPTTEAPTPEPTPDEASETTAYEKKVYTFEEIDESVDGTGWNLILVNKDNPVPDDYSISFTDLSNGKQVDTRIYPALQKMFDDARATGIDLFVREGYRTRDAQQRIMDSRIQQYMDQGNSREDAEALAKQYVAEPGTSEHELGISVDINANNNISSDDAVYGWLDENAYKYGFIKRYPSDKTDITGINNEPWHYRFVGQEAAKEMKETGMCLEEYLEYLEQE